MSDGPEMERLRSLTGKLGLEKNIEFCGFLENYDDALALMKSSRAFASPSTREGFGMAALDANAERRIAGRQAALGSLSEDIEILRRKAHDLRAKTIADLERYLDDFCEQAQANGMIIHHAADAG